MNRRSFLTRLAALGAGIVVVGPSVLAEVQRNVGLADLLDEVGGTQLWGISESTFPRWKPYRRPTVTVFHPEVLEHLVQIARAQAPTVPEALTIGPKTAAIFRQRGWP